MGDAAWSVGQLDMCGGAIIAGAYRYLLWRTWDASAPRLLWVLLNPSTADGVADDPTLRRCISFTRGWRYGGLIVANLFALRTPQPRALRCAPDPVGAEDDGYLAAAASSAGAVIVGWGAAGGHQGRDRAVLALLADAALLPLLCLGTLRDGQPRHPLYVAGSTRPMPFVASGESDSRSWALSAGPGRG
jgi:hypothetical protein